MAGDAFTQIRNAVFRDSRLTGKAMGIFGNISTHRDGWGITPETISTQMRDGVGAIKAGLRELEKYGYLRRTRTRNADGTLGSSVYYITDQPELFDEDEVGVEVESGTSEPRVGIPPVVHPPMVEPPVDPPPVDEPTVADRLHKKTIPLQEDQLEEDDLSLPSVPTQRTEPAPVTAERETFAPPNNKPATPAAPAAPVDAADRIIDAYTKVLGRPVLTRTRCVLHQQAAEALTAGYPEDWLTDRARELAAHGWTDLAKHIEKSLAPLPGAEPTTTAASGLPPWCGECGSGYGTAAQFNTRFRRRTDGTLCHCHPDTARSPLPGTDTTVSGWYALADQLRTQEQPHTGYLPRPQPTPEERAADLGHF